MNSAVPGDGAGDYSGPILNRSTMQVNTDHSNTLTHRQPTQAPARRQLPGSSLGHWALSVR